MFICTPLSRINITWTSDSATEYAWPACILKIINIINVLFSETLLSHLLANNLISLICLSWDLAFRKVTVQCILQSNNHSARKAVIKKM